MKTEIWMLYQGQENLIVLFCALCIAVMFRTNNVFGDYLNSISSLDRRMNLIVTSIFTGVLPIEGRVSISIPLYEQFVNPCTVDRRCCVFNSEHTSFINVYQRMGFITYLATHHYYLWSPLEKSVLILLSGLHLTYLQFLSYTGPMLVLYLLFFVYIIYKYVPSSEDCDKPKGTSTWYSPTKEFLRLLPFMVGILASIVLPIYYVFSAVLVVYVVWLRPNVVHVLTNISWKTLIMVGLVIALSNFFKGNAGQIEKIFIGADTASTFVMSTMVIGTALMSYMLGSSSKYAGITVAVCSVLGMTLFPLVFVCEYSGYLLSPVHKCTMISYKTFKTPAIEFFKVLMTLCSLLLIVSLFEMVKI